MKFQIHMVAIFLVLLTLGCTASEPEGKDTEGAIDISAMKAPPQDQEGSVTKTAPPLTDQQLAEGSGTEGDQGHPNLNEGQKVQRQIILPKTVEGKWKAVKILIRDKTDDEQSVMKTVDLGSQFTLANGTMTVTADQFLPNFVLTKTEVTSQGNELKNPAVHLVVTENGKEIYNGWTFAMYPTLYAFEHERYGFQLMDFIPSPTS